MKKALIVFMVLAVLVGGMNVSAATYNTKTTEAVKGTPVIDGVIDDIWADAKEIDANLVNKTLIPSETTTTAKVKTMWDDNFFYILAVVSDTAVHNDASSGDTAAEARDSIEYGIDEGNDKAGENNVSAGNPLAGVYRVGVNDSLISGFGDKFTADQSKIQAKCVVTAPGYIAEMAIPWTNAPAIGRVIGMEVQINDNITGEGRGGLVTWNSEECLGWRDTASHGNVVLAAAVEKAVPTEAETAAPATDAPAAPVVPVTGDYTAFILLGMAAALAVAVVTLKTRKSNNK